MKNSLLPIIVGILAGLANFWGHVSAEKSMKIAAIEAGVAHYETELKTGDEKFVFACPTTGE